MNYYGTVDIYLHVLQILTPEIFYYMGKLRYFWSITCPSKLFMVKFEVNYIM